MMQQTNQSKSKFSFKEALFGGNGSANTDYRIIYFGITPIQTNNGIEQYVNILYGNELSVYTNMFPIMSLLFSVTAEVPFPIIRLNKRILPGGSKAEIFLPNDFSFFGMSSMNVQQRVDDQPYDNFPFFEDEQRSDTEASESEIEHDQTLSDIQIDDSAVSTTPIKKSPFIEEAPEDKFVATFDDAALSDKIAKFMSKHDPEIKPQRVQTTTEEDFYESMEDIKSSDAEKAFNKIISNESVVDQDEPSDNK